VHKGPCKADGRVKTKAPHDEREERYPFYRDECLHGAPSPGTAIGVTVSEGVFDIFKSNGKTTISLTHDMASFCRKHPSIARDPSAAMILTSMAVDAFADTNLVYAQLLISAAAFLEAYKDGGERFLVDVTSSGSAVVVTPTGPMATFVGVCSNRTRKGTVQFLEARVTCKCMKPSI